MECFYIVSGNEWDSACYALIKICKRSSFVQLKVSNYPHTTFRSVVMIILFDSELEEHLYFDYPKVNFLKFFIVYYILQICVWQQKLFMMKGCQ